MEPLIALVVTTLVLYIAGVAGAHRLRPWPVPLRGGLAVMFTMTGVAHFVGMREEMIMMVPPALPAPDALVTLTGILELAGAVGLLVRWAAPWAAAGLTALLIVMFPANVYAAVDGIVTEAYDALLPRTVMQLVFLAATIAVYLGTRPKRRAVELAVR
jgi:uncharacterized membrane protein